MERVVFFLHTLVGEPHGETHVSSSIISIRLTGAWAIISEPIVFSVFCRTFIVRKRHPPFTGDTWDQFQRGLYEVWRREPYLTHCLIHFLTPLSLYPNYYFYDDSVRLVYTVSYLSPPWCIFGKGRDSFHLVSVTDYIFALQFSERATFRDNITTRFRNPETCSVLQYLPS